MPAWCFILRYSSKIGLKSGEFLIFWENVPISKKFAASRVGWLNAEKRGVDKKKGGVTTSITFNAIFQKAYSVFRKKFSPATGINLLNNLIYLTFRP